MDVGGHILYSPLHCQTPLPGFERFRFCVSQYEEKDRLLLRNLCFVLGAKFMEKLTKKVTHLLCKFAGGLKYEAACKWGIPSITSEWIYECVRQVYSCFSFSLPLPSPSPPLGAHVCCVVQQYHACFIFCLAVNLELTAIHNIHVHHINCLTE